MASNFVPQVDYTSRDYAAIRDNMIALIPSLLPEWTSTDASDFGITLIELFAYMGDMLNYYIDRAANEGFINTATQRASVLSIAQLLGYTPSSATPATVTLNYSNLTNADISVLAKSQVATTTNVNGLSTQIIFEVDVNPATSDGSWVISANSSASVPATQGETILYEHIGDSDGSANQVYALSQSPLLSGSSSIIVGSLVGGIPTGVVYTEIPYIIDAGFNDPSYAVTTDADNISYINFGDGISGRIPPINGIYATYRIGGGALGNVGPQTLTYPLTNIVPGLKVSNTSSASGGADEETTDSIRINAPQAYTALSRAVSLKDYGSLAVQLPSIAKAIADSGSAYNNIILYVAPFGDSSLGTPGVDVNGTVTSTYTDAATSLISYMQDKAPATTTLTVNPPVYVPISISLTAYIQPQYKQSVVVSAINTALQTLFDFTNTVFAENVVLQYIHSGLSQVDGIDHVDISLLTRADAIFTGTITAGNSTISAVSSFLNLNVGQQITLASGSESTATIPSGTTISSINTGAGTITLSANAGGTGSSTAASMWTSSLALTGINSIQCATNEIPKAGTFIITPSGGIVG